MKKNVELRKSERLPFKQMIRYGKNSPTADGFTYDLSAEGLGIFCEAPLEPGTEVLVDIKYDGETIRATGQVRWSHGQKGMNVRAGLLLVECPARLKDIYEGLKAAARRPKP